LRLHCGRAERQDFPQSFRQAGPFLECPLSEEKRNGADLSRVGIVNKAETQAMNTKALSLAAFSFSLLFVGAADASTNILTDGQFFNPIGVGYCGTNNWCDWTGAGITTSPMTNVFLGNYASLPNSPNGGADLFQDFVGPAPGEYTLSFLVQNASPWASELVLAYQEIGGGGWYAYLDVLNLAASSAFILETLTVNLTEPAGTPSEFYFSNSYDSTTCCAAAYFYPELANSVNPPGTIINIADVSLTEVTPLPAALPLFAAGLGMIGLIAKRKKRKNAVAPGAA